MTEPTTVTTAELRAHLAIYLREAAEGHAIYVTHNGYRVAALVAVADAEQIQSRR